VGVESLRNAAWIVISDQAERAGVEQSLEEALDAGEAAAITLAQLLGATVLLIDERKGRAVARERWPERARYPWRAGRSASGRARAVASSDAR
jgi:hypothetical protein